MMKFVSTLIFCFMFSISYGQTFSYSFSGDLNQESIEKIELECLKLTDVKSCKTRYKLDSHKGELILVVDSKDKRGEADAQFSVTDIKTLLIENGLEPINFLKLND